MQGWIKLHRKMLDNGVAKSSDHLACWVTLLLLAQHDGQSIIWNGKDTIIKRGELLTGRKSLASQLGMSESKIERLLSYFEKSGKIEQQKTTKFRIIKVLKYDQYQQREQQVNNKRTTSEQQVNTYKNGKNEKNDNNDGEISKKLTKWLKGFESIENPQAYAKKLLSTNSLAAVSKALSAPSTTSLSSFSRNIEFYNNKL